MQQRWRRWRTGIVAVAMGIAQGTLAWPAAAQTPATSAAMASAPAPGAPATGCSYHWVGREAEIEAFLETAPIVRVEDIPIGVTKPRRAFFEDGSLVGSMAWKVLRQDRRRGFPENHRAEIAAYRLSRLLEMHMVPPVVERRYRRQTGAAVMWIENVRRWDVKNPPKTGMRNWSRQVSRMKLFDQLIANIDRNQGNLLHDEDGHLFLIDHSRAFTTRTTLRGLQGPSQIDRTLWTRIDALTREQLDAALGDTLTSLEIKAMLKRRDAMRQQVDTLARTRGEAIAFLPVLQDEAGATTTASASVQRQAGA